MRKAVLVGMGIMLGTMALAGCGKKTGLEGKVVDGKDAPMANVKVIAQESQPGKKSKQFTSTTGSDGVFKFGRLSPMTAYRLVTYPDGTTKNAAIDIESGPEGQTTTVPEPIRIRFQFSKDGVTALDTTTGLMWTGNINILGRHVRYSQATAWVDSLDVGGYNDWRLPTKAESIFTDNAESSLHYLESAGFEISPTSRSIDYWYSDSVSDINNPKSTLLVWPVRNAK